ncbi:hypothetical protein F5884DRAFT_848654 [Xylogone sp. PMI_703]|nr:hypothetical protein F5884DRAFT_848654 [Xylogone sp. PMI_703]
MSSQPIPTMSKQQVAPPKRPAIPPKPQAPALREQAAIPRQQAAAPNLNHIAPEYHISNNYQFEPSNAEGDFDDLLQDTGDAEAVAAFVELQEANDALSDENEQLQLALKELKKRIKQLNELTEAYYSLEDEAQKLRRTNQVLAAESSSMKNSREKLQVNAKTLQDDLDKVYISSVETGGSTSQLEEENRSLKGQVQTTKIKLSQAEKEITRLQSLPEIESELDQEKLSRQQLNVQLQTEREEHRTTITELSLLKARREDESQHGNTRFSKAQKVFEDEIDTLRNTVKLLQASVVDFEESKRSLEPKVSTYEKEMESFRHEKENKYFAAAESLSDLESRLRWAEREKKVFENDLAREKALNAKLAIEIETEKGRHDVLTTNITAQREQYEAEIAGLKTTVRNAEYSKKSDEEGIKSHIATLDRRLTQMDYELANSKRNLAEETTRSQNLRQELDVATRKLREGNIEGLQQQIKDGIAKINRLQILLKEARTVGSHANCLKKTHGQWFIARFA